MRFLIGLTGLAVLLTGCSQAENRESAASSTGAALLARYHFIGAAAAAADTNSAKLKEIWKLKETRPFVESILAKFARAPFEACKSQLPGGAPDHVADLQPLIQELVEVESCGEWHAAGGAPMEQVLAVRLSDVRAAAWSRALAKTATDWSGRPTNALPNPAWQGWQLQKHDSPNLVQVVRAGSWLILGAGNGPLKRVEAAVQRAALNQLPVAADTNEWLNLTADLPAIARRVDWQPPVRLGTLNLAAVARDDDVRLEGSMHYASPLNLRLPEWKIPKRLVNEPLRGCTFIRGLNVLLTNRDWARELGLTTIPDQVMFWAIGSMPFYMHWSAPMEHTTDLLASLAPRLNALASSHLPSRTAGHFEYVATNAYLHWKILPFISPFLRKADDGNQEYLFGGLLPVPALTNHPPQALYDAFENKPDVVYYDWEITHDRLVALRQLTQLASVVFGRKQADGNQPGWMWIPEVAPLLGNTVTQVTLTSQTDLHFTRRGRLGLTGAEITLLVRMIQSDGFPLHLWNWLEPDPKAFYPVPEQKKPPARPAKPAK